MLLGATVLCRAACFARVLALRELFALRAELCGCSRRPPVAAAFWLQVCRAILLLLCWIPFNYTGYPMTWRTFLVFLWGGLRGAVGMVMALFVFLDEEIHNSKFRSYAIFYMGTMVRLHTLAGVGPHGCRPGLSWVRCSFFVCSQRAGSTHCCRPSSRCLSMVGLSNGCSSECGCCWARVWASCGA